MVNEIGQVIEEEFYTIEESIEAGQCFDLDYEFDAPQCYDFSCVETDWEAEQAERWFDSAGSYPPSPFVIKLKWRYDINGDGEFGNGSTECDEDNGSEACNRSSDGNMGDKTDSRIKASPSKSSRLMKPTASYLAKQNQSKTVPSNQFQKRLQKIADRFNKSRSFNEDDATKRQKLEVGFLCKVAHLKHQSKFVHKEPKTVRSFDGIQNKPKVTVPREPELQTARRAQRNRSKDKAEPDENAKSKVHLFKARPLNKKILEAPSFPLPKKSLPQPPEFQVFHLRTSERAKQHASNNAMKVAVYVSTSRNENTHLRSFKSINSLKEEKHEAVNKSKACAHNKKVTTSRKGANGVLQNMNQTTATTRLPDELPIELPNKLSQSSELRSGEKSQEKIALSKGLKENEPSTLLLQRQIMKVAKEQLQRNARMQYPCRTGKNTEIGQQEKISRRLRLEVV